MSKGSFLKSILVACVFIMTTIGAIAQGNVLHSVEISQNGETYNLKLKTDEMISPKKRVENKNSAYFELKNIIPAEDIDTVYNDVTDLDGIIIQQIDKSKIRIYINGYMAAKTKVSVETATNIIREQKNIVVNRPRNEYAPVTPIEDYEDNDWENNGFNLTYLTESIQNAFNGGNIDYMMIIGIGVIILSLIGIKKALSKSKVQEEIIGISPNSKKIFAELGGAEYNVQKDLMKKLQIENSKKEQATQLNTNYIKPDITRKNYAINSYNQAQNFDPYSNTQHTGTVNMPNRKSTAPTKPKYSSNIQGASNPYRTRKQTSAEVSSKKVNKNMDNLKFLESVTKIYEQSGRKDLAQGIKSNLSKQKVAI